MKLSEIVTLGILIAFLLVAGPWCFIWAINQLLLSAFPLATTIEFTFWNWVAAMIIGGLSILPSTRRS